jgi:mannosyltransferase
MTIDSLRTPAPPLPSERLQEPWHRRAVTRLTSSTLPAPAIGGLLLALTLVSLVLRIGQLNFHYWVDEGISVGISSHPLSQLPTLLREDGSPPLYYVLLHFWMSLFGRGEVATHALSLVFSLIAIPVAYWAGASLSGRRTGAYCAILTAGLPFLTEYAQETRMYSLLALLSLLAAASFVHVFVFRHRRYLPLFIVSLTAALYTHNWALFLGLTSFIAFLWCVWYVPAPRAGLLRDGALAFGVVALLYLPWLPTLIYQARYTGAPWALPPVVWSFTQGAYFLVGGRGAAMALLLAAGTGLAAIRAGGHADRLSRKAAVSLAVLGVGTLLVAWLYAKVAPAWAFRYLAVIVGPLILLVGMGLARSAKLGIVALVLVCCFWVLDPKATSRDSKSNVASAARAVSSRLGSDPLVLSTQPEQVPDLAYYLPHVTRFGTPIGPVPDPRVMDWRNALERFRRTSVHSVLVPMLRSVSPGERVALVVPMKYVKAPEWMVLIHHSSTTWTRYLKHDRQFTLVKTADPHAYSSGLPVYISVFARKR